MIKSLYVKDFILIDELKLDFDKGFNVITGETGAGKSIMINAIDIIFGAKAKKEIIKTGASKAFIELTLCDINQSTKSIFEENEIDYDSNEIIISKEVSETSSRSRVNGVLVTQDFIKLLREKLIDIHSQHQTYTYIQPKFHISLLDSFANDIHKNLLQEYKTTFKTYNETLKLYEKAKENCSQTQDKIEFLKFQIKEIEDAEITNLSEDTELEKELDILSNAQILKELTYSSYWQIYGNDGNIIDALNDIKVNITKATNYDDSLNSTQEALIDALENLKEVSNSLRNYSETIEPNEQRMDEISERIGILDNLKRKYGRTLEDVIASYNRFSEELNSIEFSAEKVIELEEEIKNLYSRLQNMAHSLSESRKSNAQILSTAITEELEKLELPKSRFNIAIEQCELNNNGTDNVEFLISTNISESLKPLIKVASGGEISRVMLAIKSIFANSDEVNTVIFDEIDTGISGKASQSVADALLTLSKSHQVIVITHQPIIAAKGTKHFYVAKSQKDTTKIFVHDLNEENKLKAIAILASGDVTDESLNLARQLVNS
ncbi:DNA repair protein RecN [bacterium]|nr:DNA repair protein RecN [bacterium]